MVGGSSETTLLSRGERYSVADFGDSGVLVDLESGFYFRLNRSAVRLFGALQEAHDHATAVAAAAEALRLSPSEASTMVDETLAMLGTMRPPAHPQEPYRYVASPRGYELQHEGVTLVRVTEDGGAVTIMEPPDGSPLDVAERLRLVAPKILALQQVIVLHGSACEVGGALTAFCGPSGAGKTTTARAVAAAGRPMVSEDLLILSTATVERGVTEVFVTGEATAHRWSSDTAAQMTSRGSFEISCASLGDTVARGPTLPLREIFFIERTRRAGTSLATHRLDPADTMLSLIASNFLAASDRSIWRRYADVSARLSRAIEAHEASMPQGLAALRAAMFARYRVSSAS